MASLTILNKPAAQPAIACTDLLAIMTIDEFKQTGWGPGMRVEHVSIGDAETFPVASVDFEEFLVGLLDFVGGTDDDHIHWVRCENVSIANTLAEARRPAE